MCGHKLHQVQIKVIKIAIKLNRKLQITKTELLKDNLLNRVKNLKSKIVLQNDHISKTVIEYHHMTIELFIN